MKKLNAKEQQLRNLVETFRASIPSGAMLSCGDPRLIKELAVRLGVLDRLQRKAQGRYSNVISRHHVGTDTVCILTLAYDSTDSAADRYWGTIIELTRLRSVPGGMELLERFYKSFTDLFGGVPSAEEIGLTELN